LKEKIVAADKRDRTGKKVRGDTRVKAIKMTVMSKKGRQFFREKWG